MPISSFCLVVLVLTASLSVVQADIKTADLLHELSVGTGLFAGKVGHQGVGYANIGGQLPE